jgi:hypothetical protein
VVRRAGQEHLAAVAVMVGQLLDREQKTPPGVLELVDSGGPG